ncbi:MAG TPA: ABC transporter ATP-binding protein [Pseudonocardia sp.]|jgi:peptide/nickel transport system ATP-binding protein
MTAQPGCPLLEVIGLSVQYPGLTGLRCRPAVDGVDLVVRAGESVGLVGMSGSGKSTVARAVTGQLTPQRGRITFAGRDLLGCAGWVARRRRSAMRLLVGAGYAALPPNRRVDAIVAEPLDPLRRMDSGYLTDILEQARLTPARSRYPHQLSRGERQRVALARAMVTRPRLVLADEPTGMLPGSACRELIDLLNELRARQGTAVLYLTEDLGLARRGCDRLVVLRGGRVIEQGPTERVLNRPEHPYTAELIAAAAAKAA